MIFDAPYAHREGCGILTASWRASYNCTIKMIAISTRSQQYTPLLSVTTKLTPLCVDRVVRASGTLLLASTDPTGSGHLCGVYTGGLSVSPLDCRTYGTCLISRTVRWWHSDGHINGLSGGQFARVNATLSFKNHAATKQLLTAT